MCMAFGDLDDDGQKALRQDLEQVFAAHNESKNGVTALRSEYLDIRTVRR